MDSRLNDIQYHGFSLVWTVILFSLSPSSLLSLSFIWLCVSRSIFPLFKVEVPANEQHFGSRFAFCCLIIANICRHAYQFAQCQCVCSYNTNDNNNNTVSVCLCGNCCCHCFGSSLVFIYCCPCKTSSSSSVSRGTERVLRLFQKHFSAIEHFRLHLICLLIMQWNVFPTHFLLSLARTILIENCHCCVLMSFSCSF